MTITTTHILEKFEQVFANVAPEKVEALAKELAKVTPLPHSLVESRIGRANDESLGIVHCSISFKTQVGGTSINANMQTLLNLFLENIESQAFEKLAQALDLILQYAQPPFHLNYFPSLHTEAGIAVIYFTIEAKHR